MKYVVTWKPRVGGSVAENEASVVRGLELYSKWTPASDTTIHQFVLRVDGEGGFAVVETDTVASIAATVAKLGPIAEYAVYPVMEVDEAIRIGNEAIEFRRSIT